MGRPLGATSSDKRGRAQLISEIAARLLHARSIVGFSQAELAQRAKVSAGNVGDFERGRCLMGLDMARSLALALKVKVSWLAFGEGRGPKAQPETEVL